MGKKLNYSEATISDGNCATEHKHDVRPHMLLMLALGQDPFLYMYSHHPHSIHTSLKSQYCVFLET